ELRAAADAHLLPKVTPLLRAQALKATEQRIQCPKFLPTDRTLPDVSVNGRNQMRKHFVHRRETSCFCPVCQDSKNVSQMPEQILAIDHRLVLQDQATQAFG